MSNPHTTILDPETQNPPLVTIIQKCSCESMGHQHSVVFPEAAIVLRRALLTNSIVCDAYLNVPLHIRLETSQCVWCECEGVKEAVDSRVGVLETRLERSKERAEKTKIRKTAREWTIYKRRSHLWCGRFGCWMVVVLMGWFMGLVCGVLAYGSEGELGVKGVGGV